MVYVDGYSSQIDHIVVSQYGIFVIETKQYHGFFTGSKYDRNWVVHYGKEKKECINPIRQNYIHILNLRKLLKLDESKFINIICFPGGANVKYIKHDGELTGYNTIVDKILSYKDTIIDKPELIEQIIIQEKNRNAKKKKQFIKNLKKIKS